MEKDRRKLPLPCPSVVGGTLNKWPGLADKTRKSDVGCSIHPPISGFGRIVMNRTPVGFSGISSVEGDGGHVGSIWLCPGVVRASRPEAGWDLVGFTLEMKWRNSST